MTAHWVMWNPRQTLGYSLSDVQANTLADKIADTLSGAKALISLSDTTRSKGIRPGKADKKLDRLGDIRAKKLVDTVAETIQEAESKTRHVGRAQSLNTFRLIEKCACREAGQNAG